MVRQSVGRLPERAREVVLLHYFSGLTHEQIAAALGTSPQAVHGRLLRARRKMAEDLRRNGLGEGKRSERPPGKERTMSFPQDDNELDRALAEAFTPPPPADFDAWQRQHSQAVECLDPQRMIAFTRRRRMMSRIVVFATTAAVLVGVWLGLTHFAADGPGSTAFAQVFEQIQKAKTITWKTTSYKYSHGKDGKGKGTWIKTEEGMRLQGTRHIPRGASGREESDRVGENHRSRKGSHALPQDKES